jgi:hypothetical protein
MNNNEIIKRIYAPVIEDTGGDFVYSDTDMVVSSGIGNFEYGTVNIALVTDERIYYNQTSLFIFLYYFSILFFSLSLSN